MKSKGNKVLVLNISEPGKVARKFIKRKFASPIGCRLVRFNEQWFAWEDGAYSSEQDEYFRAGLRKWLEKQELVKNSRTGGLTGAVCTIRTVSEALAAVIPRVVLKSESAGFFWTNGQGAIADPKNIITYKNGLLDVTTMKLYPHTPKWFALGTLPFDYEPSAKCPRWLHWLNDASRKDKDWIECLQLWFGYNLVPDTSKQRFAHFYGPTRTGKGTATRVLAAILGKWNCASPTLSQMGNNVYVLGGLVGKLAALVPDAVIGRNTDSKVVMELLSAMIGEDGVDIHQKYLPVMSSIKLLVRFTITSNEPLKWPDPTNKLSSRSIVFPFLVSYRGKEDPSVERGLMEELPGIANWALQGLRKLLKGAPLREPKAGKDKHALFSDLDSPLSVFCRLCLLETDERLRHSNRIVGVPVTVVHAVWNAWSREEGRPTKGQTRIYIKSLIIGAFPFVEVRRRGKRGRQTFCYVGLTLSSEGKRLLKVSQKRGRVMSEFKASLGL